MSIFSKAIAAMKAQYIPTVDNKVKMTINGDIACPSGGEYRAFVNGEITSVPEDLLIDVPVYRIAKPIDQVKPGDIIKTFEQKKMKSGYIDPEGKYTYRKVLEVKDGAINTISFSGTKSTQTPVKDFFFGQKTASVVVNLMSGITGGDMNQNMMLMAALSEGGNVSKMLPFMMMQNNGQMNMQNMAVLMALSEDDDCYCGESKFKKMLPFLVMQNGSNQQFNPMMLALMSGGDVSDAVMFMMMQQNGQNPFTLFNAKVPTADVNQAADNNEVLPTPAE